jgi:hypothetical protein
MNPRRTPPTRLIGLVATTLLLVGCGSSAASAAPSGPAAASQAPAAAGGGASQPALEPTAVASTDPGAAGSDGGGGPIGGDIGDRSKGSVQARISGGYTASVDLPFGAALAQFGVSGTNTAYLPYTDVTNGTLFLTIGDGSQLLVQYAGPGGVGMTNGATPCELHIDTLDDHQAKGSFTCKGMLLIQGDAMGNADMTASFEGRK